jgi:hypothetical protein
MLVNTLVKSHLHRHNAHQSIFNTPYTNLELELFVHVLIYENTAQRQIHLLAYDLRLERSTREGLRGLCVMQEQTTAVTAPGVGRERGGSRYGRS